MKAAALGLLLPGLAFSQWLPASPRPAPIGQTQPGQTQPAQTQPAPGPATAAIEGQVLNAATGAPLKRATVRLVQIGRAMRGGPPPMSARETDEQGHFAFSALEAGKYDLSVERQGFIRQSYGAHKHSNGGMPLILALDQHMKSIVFKLSPQGVIAGKVLDEDGEGVANVQVRVFRMAYRSGRKQWVQGGGSNTSDIGEYRLPNLQPGRYLVATAQRRDNAAMMQTATTQPLPDKPDMVYGATYFPHTLDQSAAASVEVGSGTEVRGIDIRLVKTPVYRVRGIAPNLSAGGRGMVMVMAVNRDGHTISASAPARAPDNRFEIHGLAPGSYMLFAQPNGGGPNQQNIAFQPVEIAASHVDNVALSFTPGSDVQGSVKVEDASGPVDLSNFQVYLRPAFPMPGQPRAKLGENNTFTLKNVAAIRYFVSASGYPENCYIKSIRYGGQEITDAAGADISGGVLEVILSATAGQIDAAVVDGDGKPASNVTVSLIAPDGTSNRSNSSDENGLVTFRGLRPGGYQLMAWEDVEPGAWQDPDFRKPFETRAESVKLDPGARAAVKVKLISAAETDK